MPSDSDSVSSGVSAAGCFASSETLSVDTLSLAAPSSEVLSCKVLSSEAFSDETPSVEALSFEVLSFEAASSEMFSFEFSSFEFSPFEAFSFEFSPFEAFSFEFSPFVTSSFEAPAFSSEARDSLPPELSLLKSSSCEPLPADDAALSASALSAEASCACGSSAIAVAGIDWNTIATLRMNGSARLDKARLNSFRLTIFIVPLPLFRLRPTPCQRHPRGLWFYGMPLSSVGLSLNCIMILYVSWLQYP